MSQNRQARLISDALENIAVPQTTKKYLQLVQEKFSTPFLLPKASGEFGVYLFANDATLTDNYMQMLDEAIANLPPESPAKITFFDHPVKKPNLGVVVGNGYIFSLLDQIPADDILLMDIEPLVHYFIFCIRKLILGCDESSTNFDDIKQNLIDEINTLEFLIMKSNNRTVLKELALLGDKHFLSSKERFVKCKQALRNKDLIPIKLNMFDIDEMKNVGDFLLETGCEISFMNLTNLIDYDKQARKLQWGLHYFPFSKRALFVSTSMIVDHPIFFKHCNEMNRVIDYVLDTLNKPNCP